MALFAVGVNAQDLTVTWADGSKGVADPSANATDIARNVGSGLVVDGTSTYGDLTLAKFNQNTGNDKGTNNYSSATSLNKYVEYTFTPQGGSFSAKKISFDIVKNGTGDPNIFVDIIDGEGTTTHVGDNVAIVRNNETASSEKSFEVSSASSEGTFALRIYVGKLASGKSVGIANVKISGTIISSDAPVLSANPTAVSLKVTPWKHEVSQAITFSGKNLIPGTYTIALEQFEGLSLSSDNVVVGDDGLLNSTVDVIYKTEANVAETTKNVSLAISGNSVTIPVTVKSNAVLISELKAVDSDTEWDFTTVNATEERTAETLPSNSDWVVYANYDEVTFPFDAKTIAFQGQFPFRKDCAQAGTLKIKISEPGVLSVDFSDTGASGDNPDERYLTVNGTPDLVIKGEAATKQFFTQRDGTSDRKTVENICVLPGEITIGATLLQPNADTGSYNTYVKFYKVTYKYDDSVTKGTTTGISELSGTMAENAVYNLAGQRVVKAQKGLFIINGKKVVK